MYLQCLKSKNSIKLLTIHTVWKFHDFSITQILCEIKIGESRVSKSAIFTHLEALNFDFFMNFCTFWKPQFTWLTRFRAPKMAKMCRFRTYKFSKSWFHVKFQGQKMPEICTLCYSASNLKIPSNCLHFTNSCLFTFTGRSSLSNELYIISSLLEQWSKQRRPRNQNWMCGLNGGHVGQVCLHFFSCLFTNLSAVCLHFF